MKKKNKAENKGIGTLLEYLDNQLELFRQKNNYYPNLILMSKETKDKIFAELDNYVVLDNCWFDKKDNYRNIPIEIRDIDFLKLEGIK
jgi:hypothetical protein